MPRTSSRGSGKLHPGSGGISTIVLIGKPLHRLRSCRMRATLLLLATTALTAACQAPSPYRQLAPASPAAGEVARNSTFCNPLDLDYRFMLDGPSRREAADPVITLYG